MYQALIKWIHRLMKRTQNQVAVIGFANYRSSGAAVVREGSRVFLVDLKNQHHKLVDLSFTSSFERFIQTLRKVEIKEVLRDGSYLMVGEVQDKRLKKTVVLRGNEDFHFTLVSLAVHPHETPSKILLGNHGDLLLSSLKDELVYREINPAKKQVIYHSANVASRHDGFDHAPLSVVLVEPINAGVFVIYDASYELRGYQNHLFGAVLLNPENLSEVLWRATWEQTPYWEEFVSRTESKRNARVLGGKVFDDKVFVYFVDDATNELFELELHEPFARRDPKPGHTSLSRFVANPVVRPNPKHSWENHNTFNPSALVLDNQVHLLYRAEGEAGLSVIGYGMSNDGYSFAQLPYPVYVPRMNFEGVGVPRHYMTGHFKSGYRNYEHHQEGETPYRWHGVEDPRVTLIDGRIYMIYAAYNGYQQARPAITSIAVEDFKAQNFNWAVPQPMTPQAHNWGGGNKNVVLHPEKVKGKFMIYHRIWPHIRIDYVDSLEFGPEKQWLKEVDRIPTRGDSWDSERVGVSAAPILIDEGWLMIYQGSGSQDRRYKVGAMILDRDDPTKILYRSSYPILAPEAWYENENKAGVAYPCGAVVHEGMLKVYYGGSDRYVCIGEAPIEEFVNQLKQDPYEIPHLKSIGHITKR